MKEIVKPALGMFVRQIIVTFMNIFVCISFMVLCTAGFTKVIGYDAYVYEKDGTEPIEQYTYYSADGEDTKKAEFEEKGYTVTTSEKRSTMSKSGNAVYYSITQIIALLLMTGFIYPNLWSLGAKDSNLVKFKHKNEDKLRGFKIGLIAAIPPIVLMLVIFILGRNIFNVALFALIFANFYSFIELISGSAIMLSDLAVWQMVLMVLIIFIAPAIAGGAYLLGYKDISISEKIIYKKNKEK